jgi:D-alanine transaminase
LVPEAIAHQHHALIVPDDIVYFNGEFRRRGEVCLSPDDRGLYFGDGAYEVVRFYDGRPFQMDAHLARFTRSLAALRIEGVDVPALAAVFVRLVADNDLKDALAYIQVTRGATPRRHSFPPGVEPTVWGFAQDSPAPEEEWRTGVPVITQPDVRWGRCDIKSLNLLPNVMAKQRSVEAETEEAILVKDGLVTEGSHTNVAAAFGGTLVTHPEGTRILSGITRGVVLSLCRELGIPVEERPIPLPELYRADEVMIFSSRDEVMPVIRVDERAIGDGRPGPVARRLLEAFQALRPRAGDS